MRERYAEAAKILDDDRRKRAIKHALSSESVGRLGAMIELVKHLEGVSIQPDALDADAWLLNLQNGTLELKTGKFREHRRGDLMTKMCPARLDPTATCPTWERFIHRIMDGRPGLVGFLQRFAGLCLSGDTSDKAMFIAHGSGNNGKSIFSVVLGELLGDYATETPTESLMTKKGDGGISNDLARLNKIRLVTASEGELGQHLAEGLIKRLTGGDVISARFLHREFFDFIPQFKILLSTNHKPILRGGDPAIWDRVKLIPFDVAIPKAEQIPRHVFLEQLRAEFPGILNWCIDGLKQWWESGLGVPPEVEDAVAGYRAESDILSGFIDGHCVVNPLAKEKTVNLYHSYECWCTENHDTPVGIRVFGRMLEERGYGRKKIGPESAKGFGGIGLKSSDRRTVSDREKGFSRVEENHRGEKAFSRSDTVRRSGEIPDGYVTEIF